MLGLPLAFGAPLVLFGLLALPIIWWLLRLMPPRPQLEVFPPYRILARILKREETPHKSPWWLTLLRLLLTALVILALAEPVLNPRDRATLSDGPLALVIDNGWASSNDWEDRVRTAAGLIADANDTGKPVILAFTAEPTDAEIGPFDAVRAQELLAAAAPRPVPVNRAAVLARVAGSLERAPGATLAYLADGLAGDGDAQASVTLAETKAAKILHYDKGIAGKTGISAVENSATAFTVTAVRAATDTAPRTIGVGAFDEKGRRIADATLVFQTGAAETSGEIPVPFELRNDFASISIDGVENAAATRVLDDASKRRRIGLISAAEADQAQPLLSPLFYIRKALEPFADLIEPQTADLAVAIPQILERQPAIVVLADVETIPDAAREQLTKWTNEGGTLVRFAGPRLASATAGEDDPLLPVRLRGGERELGGTLSWTVPQPVAEFPASGPFAGIEAPREVTVTRQVLAEPSPDLAERTWANLGDGTPLITGRTLGKGTVALFHITPQATWSNLPISGTFVEMFRRIISISSNQGRVDGETGPRAAPMPPFRMIDALGRQGPPQPEAKPLLPENAGKSLTIENPPGLYGTADGVLAHNLLSAGARIEPYALPQLAMPVTRAAYATGDVTDLKPPLLVTALLLLAADALVVMALAGTFAGTMRSFRKASAGAAAGSAAALLFAILLAAQPGAALAQDANPSDARPGDDTAIEAIANTRLAYVVTGVASVDTVSKAGLEGLSDFLASRTALEPGEPAAIDPETDELAFYPIVYWPIDEAAPMPSPAAIARIDAYMQQGGTVLFDTRDQLAAGLDISGGASPRTERLRAILDGINVPPLEPVPADHVLTKAFFILEDFPGLYQGSPLWVEASLDASNTESRPVRIGDGVSPVIITGNDFAAAWAVDAEGNWLYPTVTADPMQRTYAFRAGVNIVMYMLTGNYKSDQVHIPALLERLGQ